MGKLVEECLVELEIEPKAKVDNNLSKTDSNIKGIDYLETVDARESLLIISTVKRTMYNEIKNTILLHFPKKQVIDLFGNSYKKGLFFKKVLGYIKSPKSILSFLTFKVNNSSKTRLLDVGCGNSSVLGIKSICDKIHYIGIDVGDYNQSKESISLIDDYIVVKPENFADRIAEIGKVDVVISSHNLEHCDEPKKVLENITKVLNAGGKLYLSFPSENSATFPKGREGCLNFYDDVTHQNLPIYEEVLKILTDNNMKIIYKAKSYRPFILGLIGKRNEKESEKKRIVLEGTWAYYGFETVIWAEKMN